jgi:hypothetical protein
LAIKLNIQRPEDWYKVPLTSVLREGGSFVNSYYKSSLTKALKAAYPEHNWNAYNRVTLSHTVKLGGSKSQSVLYDTLQGLFPGTTMFSNYRLPFGLFKMDNTNGLKFYEFDVSLLSIIVSLQCRYLFQAFLLFWNTKEKLITSVTRSLAEQASVNEQTLSRLNMPLRWESQ